MSRNLATVMRELKLWLRDLNYAIELIYGYHHQETPHFINNLILVIKGLL